MASKKLVVGEVEVIDGDPPISNFFAWLKMRAKRAGVEVFKVGNNPFLFRCSSEEELEKLIEIGVVEVGQCKFVYRKQQGKRLLSFFVLFCFVFVFFHIFFDSFSLDCRFRSPSPLLFLGLIFSPFSSFLFSSFPLLFFLSHLLLLSLIILFFSKPHSL